MASITHGFPPPKTNNGGSATLANDPASSRYCAAAAVRGRSHQRACDRLKEMEYESGAGTLGARSFGIMDSLESSMIGNEVAGAGLEQTMAVLNVIEQRVVRSRESP